MNFSRRSILKGLLAAPVIIRTPGLLMPIHPLRNPFSFGPGKYYWEVSLAPIPMFLPGGWNYFVPMPSIPSRFLIHEIKETEYDNLKA